MMKQDREGFAVPSLPQKGWVTSDRLFSVTEARTIALQWLHAYVRTIPYGPPFKP